MKVIAFGVREDEECFMDPVAKKLGIEVEIHTEHLNMETVHWAKGFDAVSIVGVCQADRDILKILSGYGIKALSTRTIGYDQIDLQSASEYGIKVANVSYSPDCVADFTILLMLALTRRFAHMLERSRCMDYSLHGIQGKEMHNLTVGIIGLGRIGSCVARDLKGFGCKIQAYTDCPREDQKDLVEFVDFDTLIKTSDIITLHMPLTDQNRYMINADVIKKMKPGVLIINTSRGEIIDTNALIEGIENGIIGGAGIDSFENEQEVIHIDHNYNVIKNRDLLILKAYPNVIVTPHAAFYTDQVSYDMVHCSLESLKKLVNNQECRYQLN